MLPDISVPVLRVIVLFLLPLLMRTALVPPVILPLTGQGVAGAANGYAIGAGDCARIASERRIVIAVELNGGICRDTPAVLLSVARGDVDAEYRVSPSRRCCANRDSVAVGIDAGVPGAFTRCGNGAGVAIVRWRRYCTRCRKRCY